MKQSSISGAEIFKMLFELNKEVEEAEAALALVEDEFGKDTTAHKLLSKAVAEAGARLKDAEETQYSVQHITMSTRQLQPQDNAMKEATIYRGGTFK